METKFASRYEENEQDLNIQYTTTCGYFSRNMFYSTAVSAAKTTSRVYDTHIGL